MDKVLKDVEKIARDVYKKLGSGHREVVYQRAMEVGLRLAGYKYEREKVLELTYKKHYVGEGFADLGIKAGKKIVVLELKAVGNVGTPEVQQLKNYMELLEAQSGALINFEQPGKNSNPDQYDLVFEVIEN